MSVHTLHLIIVFCLVVAVFTAFPREWLSPDLVALSAMGVLLVSGVLTADETLSVFSNSAPIVISCMFVLSAGLERTGVIDSLARIFTRMAGTTERRAALALAALTLPLSALINHMPVRSEEHTSELQSRFDLVCRLLLEKKKQKKLYRGKKTTQ